MMHNLKLPDSLNSQLREFQKKLRAVESATALLAVFCIAASSFTALYISDRVWDTPVILRFALFIAGLIPFLIFIYYTVHHIFRERRDFKNLSILVQKHHQKLGDSLLGVVELAENKDLSQNTSEELCSAAISNIAEKAGSMDFCEAIDRKTLKRFLACSLAAIIILMDLFIFTRPAFSSSFLRWIMPLSPLERFTYVKITGIPQKMTVPHGEEFEIGCRLDESSVFKPSHVKFKAGLELPGKTAFVKGAAKLKISGQTKPAVLKIWSGDFRKTVKIIPVHRPVLINLEAAVKLPEYTGRDELRTKISGKSFSILEGGSYSIEGKINRGLKSAQILIDGTARKSLKICGNNFSTGMFKAEPVGKNRILWTDIYGLGPLHPFEYSVTVDKDREPVTEFPKLSPFSAILPYETLTIQAAAEDDYGVSDLGMVYSAADPKNEKKILKNGSLSLAKGAPDKTKLESEFMFCPRQMNIPEQTIVTLQSTANDYFPNRQTALSRQYKIYVLSQQEHASLIQQGLESIMAKLEDVVWREEENLEKNRDIGKLTEQEMKNEETTEKIAEQENSEKSNAEDLEKEAEKISKLVAEALRNKEFPAKTLAEWAKILKTASEVSQTDMKDVENSLARAKNGKNRAQEMANAVEEQQKLLAKLKELMKDMDDSLNSLTMENFVGRLKKESGNENAISEKLAAVMKTAIGMDQNALPEKIKNEINALKTKQEQVRKSAKDIQDDMLGFFSRTHIRKYQEVADEMDKEQIQKKLADLAGVIGRNQTAQGMKAAKEMAAKFNSWAESLEQKDNKKSSSSAADGEMQPIDPELVIGLLRLIQQEQELRDHTRSLEENKEKMSDYSDKAVKLSEKQMGMRQELKKIKDMAPAFPKLNSIMNTAEKAMTDAGAMLFKPQTDQETLGAETEVIEILSDSLMQDSEISEGSDGAMSMFMKMMLQPRGKGFKGSIHSDAANSGVKGANYKGGVDEKKPDRTSGKSAQALPEEYRDAIESYFKRVNEIDRKRK
ncbi:MAG: hypothetical protein WC637_00925 [Victivallales bacterium]|jgi:hypothetical protein